jgi:hypothetical protein
MGIRRTMHWPHVGSRRIVWRMRHGAYVCFRIADAPRFAAFPGLQNEFEVSEPGDSIAFLRRTHATVGHIADPELFDAEAIVHVASERADLVEDVIRRLPRGRVLRGVVKPMRYTGGDMHEYAYSRRVIQKTGPINAFLFPMSKTSAWWDKHWMERHTYFLPRYEKGKMVHQGHALAAEAGIACLMRRTYKHPEDQAPAGEYDFVNYFECADEDVPTYHQVCASLRDVEKNPEWSFVREGPTWKGRRMARWEDLFPLC